MKLLANENFPSASVAILRRLGYDVTSIGEDDPSISDEEVMKIAIAQERTILTFDRDYGELIFKHGFRPPKGVIYLRTDPYNPTSPAEIAHQLISTSGLELAGTLTVVSEDKVRQRRYF
jgi:predicted nuclease of predicted toxin-antitoxin system